MGKTTLLLVSMLVSILMAQPTGKVKTIFDAINAARTNPSGFYSEHKSVLDTYYAPYAAYLKKQVPIEPMQWDPGLAEMCRKSAVLNDLNPQYGGKNKVCGFSSGRAWGSIDPEPIHYLADMFTNVHDPDYAWFSMYIDAGTQTMAYQWGMRCERKKYEYTFDGKIDTSGVDFKKLNTAAGITWMTPVEQRMIAEINLVRAYPKVYAQIVAQYLEDEANSWSGLDKDTYDAGIELIEELKTMQPVSILTPMQCVYTAAKLHGLDCKKRGFFDHTGSNGSAPWDRIAKQCPELTGNENGAGNAGTDPRDPVISLLLDDGISSRGHRKNMLDPAWKYVGCYRYEDATYTFYWVQNFAR